MIFTMMTHYKLSITYKPLYSHDDKYNKFFMRLCQITTTDSITNVDLITNNNKHLDTVHIKNNDNDYCIIIFNDSHQNITSHFDVVKYLYNYASIVIYDYQAHGKSSGSISELSACYKRQLYI